MENLIIVLANILTTYLGVTICVWYFLYQTINNLELLAKGNFKDVKIRQEIKSEIDQTKQDKKKAYLWPYFVYEIAKYERALNKTKQDE